MREIRLKSKKLPRTVYLLGLTSFLNDSSSEMIHPLLPGFLSKVLGAGPAAIGLIEGIAESTASVVKLGSGLLSDRFRRKKPLIVAGYAIAGCVRPLYGLAGSWPLALAFRFADRFGKGLRSSPRDAMLAAAAPAGQRGAAFGLHQTMDHAGAVVGPLIATLLMAGFGLGLKEVFLWAAVPAALVLIVMIFLVKEAPRRAAPRLRSSALRPASLRSVLGQGRFRLFLAAVLVFTLANSSDAFILLKLSDAGVPVSWLGGLWALHHLVKIASTYTGGQLSDRLGRKPLLIAGWSLYGLVYGGLAFASSSSVCMALFLAYGLYHGLAEPVEKALVADLAPAAGRGAAFGLYHMTVGLGALPASLVFGLLWNTWGSAAAFLSGGVLALVAALLLTRLKLEGSS